MGRHGVGMSADMAGWSLRHRSSGGGV